MADRDEVADHGYRQAVEFFRSRTTELVLAPSRHGGYRAGHEVTVTGAERSWSVRRVDQMPRWAAWRVFERETDNFWGPFYDAPWCYSHQELEMFSGMYCENTV